MVGIFVLLLILYFLPTIIATAKGSKIKGQFFVYNLLSAWSIIGWFILLGRALKIETKNQQKKNIRIDVKKDSQSSASTEVNDKTYSGTTKGISEKQQWYQNLYDLMELPGIGRKTAENLLDHGFKSREEVKKLTKDELMEFDNVGPKTAEHIKEGKKMEKAEAGTDVKNLKDQNKKVREQCEEIGIPLKEIRMEFQKPNWVVDAKTFSDPEYAEAKRLRKSGFKVGLKEIFPMDVLLKSTCLNYLEKVAADHPKDSLDRPRIYLLYFGKHSDLKKRDFRKFIRNSTQEKVAKNYRKLVKTIGRDSLHLEDISKDFIVDLYHSLSEEKLCFIAEQYSKNFPEYKVGWPDITAVKDGQAHFIEVKTSDHLRDTQKRIIENIAKPVNLNYKIHRLRPEE